MYSFKLIHLMPLFAMLVIAAIGDLRERRIRNWLTLTLMLTGLAQSFMPTHTTTPLYSLLGLLSGFGITFILFFMNAIGGGDVKLLMGVGAWLGPAGVLVVFLLEAVIGMVIVLAQAIWQGRLQTLFRNSTLVLINLAHINEVGLDHVTATGKAARSVDRPLPYAVPVLIAVALIAVKSYVSRGS